MQTEELLRLVDKIQHNQCEFQNAEVKAAAGGCPTRLYGTLSSFSNQDGGGIIIFGLDERENFKLVGVYNVQDLQQKVTAQCKEMSPEVRPLFTVAEIDNKFVVSAEIPEVDVAERPVFYKGAGRLKGSYIRSGESDEPMNEYEIYTYEAFRRRIKDDLRIIEDAKMSFLREDLLRKYITSVKSESRNLADSPDQEILELMGVTKDGNPTLAGVLVFGKYPQALFPKLCITAVVVPGFQVGDTGPDDERFLDNKRFTGTIEDMLNEAVDFIMRNCRKKTIINTDGKREDKEDYPPIAVREVILNALVHRDYSIHTEGTPITIQMFNDRVEVVNKGGLYGKITVDQLGKVRPDTRNTTLVTILEVLGITENRFSGIPTIRRQMKAYNLPAPKFSDKNGEFKVVLRNDLYTAAGDEITGNKADLLEFCKEPKSMQEITDFLNFSRYYTFQKFVRPLLKSGRLRMTLPNKPTSTKQKYYTSY